LATKRLCSIEGCGKPHYGKGWCLAHYRKWQKYGNPLVGRTYAGKGVPLAWIIRRVAYQGDECLLWPFSKYANGYGDFWVNGKHCGVHRYMCELAHGPAPSPKHEALHSCGMGHLGCANPRHLRWGTSKENKADTALHGRACRGSRSPVAKLTEADVHAIRRLLSEGRSCSGIAVEFGVCSNTIASISTRKNWGWLP